jgi:hypothetical protein
LTGRGKQRVPWTELQRAQNEYIEPEYLPKQVTLKQYYHLHRDYVSAILEHWTWRQDLHANIHVSLLANSSLLKVRSPFTMLANTKDCI